MLHLRLIFIFLTFFSFSLFAQRGMMDKEKEINRVFQKKITLINPGYSIEIPTSRIATLDIHAGIGYGGSYPKLTTGFESGIQSLIAPFADIQYRVYHNLKKRINKGKYIKNNSGSFFMIRGLFRGKEIAKSTFSRTSDTDYAMGIGWGIQKYKKRLGWSFSIAPYFYFDGKGNFGVLPIFPEINVGYLLLRKNDNE